MRVRPAAVAGSFYPADPIRLRRQIEELLVASPALGEPPKALIVPHAGYLYSGPVAARAYNLIAPVATRLRRVVLLGPAHTQPLRGLAIPEAGAFQTPLGSVPLDAALLERLERLPQVQRSDAAHAREHSLEVHLPFLQVLIPSFMLVPLVVGEARPAEVAQVLATAWGGPDTLIVISSDLSHYHPYAEAQELDAATDRRIMSLAPVFDGAQACGCHAINGLLELARERGLAIRRMDLRNSGDTAGDRARVVGYGAWALG